MSGIWVKYACQKLTLRWYAGEPGYWLPHFSEVCWAQLSRNENIIGQDKPYIVKQIETFVDWSEPWKSRYKSDLIDATLFWKYHIST